MQALASARASCRAAGRMWGFQGRWAGDGGSSSQLQLGGSCSGEGASWRHEMRVEGKGHLGVGVLDEEIHNNHDQDGDGNPKVPDDPSQLRAGGRTSS